MGDGDRKKKSSHKLHSYNLPYSGRMTRKHICIFSARWSPAEQLQFGHLRGVHKTLMIINTKLFPQTVSIISISYSVVLRLRTIFFVLMMNKVVLRTALGNHHQHLIVLSSPKYFWVREEMSELSANLLMQK